MKRIITIALTAITLLSTSVGAAEVQLESTTNLTSIKQINATPTLYGDDKNNHGNDLVVSYEDNEIVFDVRSKVINGVVMVPLRAIAEALGFEINWNNENRSVEIVKGAIFTMVKIDKNSYFRNKMATEQLSEAPVIVDSRTLVPIEFFSVILQESFVIEDGQVNFNNDIFQSHAGYIQKIVTGENGKVSITISSKEISQDVMDTIIIHTSQNTTFYQINIKVGEFVRAISDPVMTMSIPGQTGAYVIY